jgi:hypothetical protein
MTSEHGRADYSKAKLEADRTFHVTFGSAGVPWGGPRLADAARRPRAGTTPPSTGGALPIARRGSWRAGGRGISS